MPPDSPRQQANAGVRTLAIGDIHGCLKSLQRVADAARIAATDRLVLLGDYVDRGPDSKGVIDWVLERQREMEVISLRGNHEVMMLESRTNLKLARNWASFGGFEALASYGTGFQQDWVGAVPGQHWAFIEATRNHFETERHIFVHGSVDGELDMADQDKQRLLWGRCFEMTPHFSGRRVVCGHTPQEDGRIG